MCDKRIRASYGCQKNVLFQNKNRRKPPRRLAPIITPRSVWLRGCECVGVCARLALMRVRYLEGKKKTCIDNLLLQTAVFSSKEKKQVTWIRRLKNEMAAWIPQCTVNSMITFPLMQISPCSCSTTCHASYGAKLNQCFCSTQIFILRLVFCLINLSLRTASTRGTHKQKTSCWIHPPPPPCFHEDEGRWGNRRKHQC